MSNFKPTKEEVCAYRTANETSLQESRRALLYKKLDHALSMVACGGNTSPTEDVLIDVLRTMIEERL